MPRIRVYVFDHSSGFDWRYSRADAEAEVSEYAKVGWLHTYTSNDFDRDTFCSVLVDDNASDDPQARADHITAQLEAENYPELDGFHNIGFDWLA